MRSRGPAARARAPKAVRCEEEVTVTRTEGETRELRIGADAIPLEMAVAERARDGEVASDAPAPLVHHPPASRAHARFLIGSVRLVI